MEEGGYSWREDIHQQNPLLNLSTHPTPLRGLGGPHQGKCFVVSQSILAYEFDALLCNKKCEVEPLIESLKHLLIPISWGVKMRREKSLFLASSFKIRKGKRVCESLKK